MQAKMNKKGDVVVKMSTREAYRIFSYTNFATREYDWSFQSDGRILYLNRDDRGDATIAPPMSQCGLGETGLLSWALYDVVGDEYAD